MIQGKYSAYATNESEYIATITEHDITDIDKQLDLISVILVFYCSLLVVIHTLLSNSPR